MTDSHPARYPDFRFFDEFSEVGALRNRLPHWRQDRACYFVTFRLNDSLPSKQLAEWRDEREKWLEIHPQPWSVEIEMEYHKRFSGRVDRWLDEGHGACLLQDPQHAERVAATLDHDDGIRYLLHSRVIMPNHVHALLSLGAGESLSGIIASWKRFSATRINKAIGAAGALWQKDYFDRMIRDWDHFVHVARYIRRNPVKAKLVSGLYSLHEAPWVQRLLG